MKKLNLIKKTGCCSSSIDINEDDIDMDYFVHIDDKYFRETSNDQIGIRRHHEFKGKALWLDSSYDYVLGKDEQGLAILVPLKKK